MTNSVVEIPKYVQGDTVVEFNTVPADWYEHLSHARRANRDAQAALGDIEGVVGIGLGRDSATFGGKNGLQVRVLAKDEVPGSHIPTEIRDIPVARIRAPEKYGPGACTNVTDDMTVYGGEAFSSDDPSGMGSTSCRVYRNGAKEMLTCAHVFWADGNCKGVSSSDLIGRVAQQFDGDGNESNNTHYGEVVAANKTGDWLTFDDSLDSDTYFHEYIDNNDGGIAVKGYVARDTLSDWASSEDHIVRSMGATSGRTSGAVAAIDWATTGNCTDLNGDGVYTYCNFGQGDSGGPTYDVSGGVAYMVSCTSYGYYNVDSCGGNTIYNDSAGVSGDHLSQSGLEFVDTSSL